MSDLLSAIEENERREQRRVYEVAQQKAEDEESKSASGFFKRLMLWIQKEETQIKDDEALLVLYYNRTGQRLYVSNIHYHNPHMIILFGQDSDGNEHRILVHMESVELDLMRVKVKDKEQDHRKIGFSIE